MRFTLQPKPSRRRTSRHHPLKLRPSVQRHFLLWYFLNLALDYRYSTTDSSTYGSGFLFREDIPNLCSSDQHGCGLAFEGYGIRDLGGPQNYSASNDEDYCQTLAASREAQLHQALSADWPAGTQGTFVGYSNLLGSTQVPLLPDPQNGHAFSIPPACRASVVGFTNATSHIPFTSEVSPSVSYPPPSWNGEYFYWPSLFVCLAGSLDILR